MIAFVRGQVAAVTLSSAVLEVGGVGLELMCTPGTLATLRPEVRAEVAHQSAAAEWERGEMSPELARGITAFMNAHSRAAGKAVGAQALFTDVRALLDGSSLADKLGFTASLLTVDANGHVRTSLLSVGELYAPDSRTLCIALWPQARATRAIAQSGRAALSFVCDAEFYQVQLRVAPLPGVAGDDFRPCLRAVRHAEELLDEAGGTHHGADRVDPDVVGPEFGGHRLGAAKHKIGDFQRRLHAPVLPYLRATGAALESLAFVALQSRGGRRRPPLHERIRVSSRT